MSSSDNNTREVLKIKEVFSNLQEENIEKIQKIINGSVKQKLRLNMTTERPSCKQVIVPINSGNIIKFISNSSNHITNINRLLKNIKSDCKAGYIQSEKSGIIIITDKVAFILDLQTIERDVKNSNQIDVENVDVSQLPQSKSYLKIIGLSYLTNTPLTLNVAETILKNNHIFNNILIASSPRVIKISPKSDMAIIWLEIWNTQSGTNVKDLINRCFNIGSFIAMVCRVNMNPSVPQCKKYWK